MICYFDATALVKRYVEEPESGRVDAVLKKRQPATSRLSLVEISSALGRRCREGDLTSDQRNLAYAALFEDASRIFLVELLPAVVELASRLVNSYPLRAGDAVQLASCLHLHRRTHGNVAFFCFDQRLNQAAESEGVVVL
ncbi:MAG: type II toxin-antitoxin system VapC family toxin [Myxococcota bacterium]|nr:type II toxin-antitoxin system VapC family toxin [Myxococcota bacterium]